VWLKKAALSLLDVQPVTGRTYQILMHLASIGHYVACDQTYTERKPYPVLKRLFLHAPFLLFEIRTEQKTVHVPPPDELTSLLRQLR
jgi:23S rRNA-/tRNA-specific pseudouridylate synthase